jgi:uncharacterized membrane protein
MTMSTLIDFLHLLATAIWIGGMIFNKLIFMPALKAIEASQRGKMLGAAAGRFVIFAWSSIVILLITGYVKTPDGMLFDMSDSYGTALTVKHVAFLAMIIIGILLSLVLVPKMKKLAPQPGEGPSGEFMQLQKKMSLLATVNMLLGIVALFCVALQ